MSLKRGKYEQRKYSLICPVCGATFLRAIMNHFRFHWDKPHQKFIEKQKKIVVNLFLKKYSTFEIFNDKKVLLNQKNVIQICKEVLGEEKFYKISKEIMGMKRRDYWYSFSEEERKKMMKPVYEAEWKNLTPEQRKNHPWVIAGRKASLNSSLKGSKNQRLAFELLKNKLSDYDWKYNLVLDENWQIDIACPEKKIFIEWDGRHHRVLIHGEGYLNNRKNRDRLKNKIVTEKLNGSLIRIRDDGRFNRAFVRDKIEEVVGFIKNNDLEEKVYCF